MKRIFTIIVLSGLVFGYNCRAQNTNFNQNDSAVASRIKSDIFILASDSFEGREAGTEGEIMARDYIISKYKAMGISPYFSGGSYTQSFTFKDSPSTGDSNFLNVNDKKYISGKDFYPVSYSASMAVSGEVVNVGYGISFPAKEYNDYKNSTGLKGKIFVIETSLPEKYRQDTVFMKFLDLQYKVDTAIARGAAGILFVNTDKNLDNPAWKLSSRILPSSVPVIFVKADSIVQMLANAEKKYVKIQADIERKTLTAYNIAAYIDNKAPTTIIIGGHYDHIGWGKENSRYTDTIPEIHNGADDNASGTAAVIELARYFSTYNKKNHNYLFINFSGEEKGLYGSSNFTKSSFFDTTKTAYMLNLDMVGRFDTSKVGLDIEGTGSSPLWDTLIAQSIGKEIKFKKTKSGFGGSDHMSFYLKNIPALSLTTGIHPDYHTPGDDAAKINFTGETKVVKFAERLIESTDTIKKLPFSKTQGDSTSTRTKFSVTLGIVPDHSYDGKGLRIEGISPGKTAEKAGLKSGDIVLKMGDYEVKEIMSYMKALGHFKKGDKTKLIIKRGEEILTIDVEFL
jgi:aminopeptidase YwaD